MVLYYFSPSTKCQNHCTTYCSFFIFIFISLFNLMFSGLPFEAFLYMILKEPDRRRIKRAIFLIFCYNFLFYFYFFCSFLLLLLHCNCYLIYNECDYEMNTWKLNPYHELLINNKLVW